MPAARDSALDKLYRIVLTLAGVYGGLSVLISFCLLSLLFYFRAELRAEA